MSAGYLSIMIGMARRVEAYIKDKFLLLVGIIFLWKSALAYEFPEASAIFALVAAVCWSADRLSRR